MGESSSTFFFSWGTLQGGAGPGRGRRLRRGVTIAARRLLVDRRASDSEA
jgi:hypothetical protein